MQVRTSVQACVCRIQHTNMKQIPNTSVHLCRVPFHRADPVSLDVEAPQSHQVLQGGQGLPLTHPIPPHIQQLQPEGGKVGKIEARARGSSGLWGDVHKMTMLYMK